jgi:outer membrane receptor protein involved in Fe transport
MSKSLLTQPNKVVAAAVATALSIPAMHVSNLLAQEPSNFALEEIIVTATKRELNIQDVGQSIMALTNEDIEKMGIKSMADYIKALPSVVLTAEVPGRNDLVMRGISQDAYTWYVDSTVALYLDEQAMTTSSQQVSVRVIDMARVESLPGPQGTLFGSTSQSGTLRMITNKPDHTGYYGSVETSYGTIKGGDSSSDINGYVNIPISDALSMRFVGYTSSDGGYVDNVYGSSYSGSFDNADIVEDNFNTYDVTGGRISALWSMSDKWSALLSYVAEDSELDGSWETDPALGDHKITRFVEEMRDDDWHSSALTLKGDLGFADLSATVTHFERDIVYLWDNNAYSHWKDAYYGYGLYDTDYTRAHTFNDQYQERDAAEIRLVSKGDSKLQWMVGYYWEDTYDTWYYGTEYPDFMSTDAAYYANYWACYYAYYYADFVDCPINTTIGYSDTYKDTVEQTAIFGEFSYDVTDKLTLGAGMRWSEFKRDTYNRDTWPEGLPPFAGGGIASNGEIFSKGKDSDTLYKLSATYTIDEDKMVYALFSQGYRIGGDNAPRAVATGEVPANYDTDYLDNYEIGIKSTWMDNTLQVNAQYFLMKWKDMQIAHWGGVGPWWVGGTVNAGTAEAKGLEIDIKYQMTENLNISGSALFNDAQFTQEYITPGGSVYRDGMIMPNSPDRKGHLGISYDKPNVAGGYLWVYYGVSFQSKTWNRTWNIINNDTNGISPSHDSSNFSMGLDDLANGWSVSLYIDNVADKATYSYVNTGANTYADMFGDNRDHNVRTLAQPRTAWLTVRKNFGR